MVFFSTGNGKNKKKNQIFVLSRRSLPKAIHIAEKTLYGSIQKFNFSKGFFPHFIQYGKKSHGIFDFLKLLISEKIILK